MRQVSRILNALVSDGRWRRSLALVVAFALGCALLSYWQFARREETVRAAQRVTANAEAPARPLADLLPGRSTWRADREWRTAVVQGEYLPDDQMLVLNRANDGAAGVEVLTPFRLQDGSVLVLDRGWVATTTNEVVPATVPAPPTGTVVVDARLRPDEGAPPVGSAGEGRLLSVDVTAVLGRIPGPGWTATYGQVRTETPAAADVPTRLAPVVDIGVDEGTHLSYAIQWILFALTAFGFLVWSIRRDLRDAGDEAVLAADARREARRGRRAPSDESVEDALVE